MTAARYPKSSAGGPRRCGGCGRVVDHVRQLSWEDESGGRIGVFCGECAAAALERPGVEVIE